MSKLVRISKIAFEQLSQLAEDMGASKQIIIEQALGKLARENLLRRGNEAYAALKQNPELWKEELEEREEWDVTLEDGLKDL